MSSPRSFWLTEALAGETDAPALVGEERADVCIVGGGYAGLWTALALKEQAPGLDIAVVEAEVCGSGASGRNGGFALTFWHHFLSLAGVCGYEEAVRLSRASDDAVARIGRFCAEHDEDVEFRHDGWLWTATNAAQRTAWLDTVAAIERHGERPFVVLRPEDVPARTGSALHLDGVFEPRAATVQPAKLVRALRRAALRQGVRLFERSPMTALERERELGVRTPMGRVRAAKVVLAMNAWSAKLRELRRAFVIVGSDMVLTEPVADELDRLGVPVGVGISDSRMMVEYYRRTRDGRLAFGKGGGVLAFGARAGVASPDAGRTARIAARLHKAYPSLTSVPIAAAWTGAVDRSLDGLPFFTTVQRPDLLCVGGFSGNGVGPAVLAGRIMASLVLEREDEWSSCGLVRRPPRGLPPEPLRYVGGRVVRAAVARKEVTEDRGGRVGPLTSRVVRLAPTGLVPVD